MILSSYKSTKYFRLGKGKNGNIFRAIYTPSNSRALAKDASVGSPADNNRAISTKRSFS
jgi:hypothetical protein